MRQSRSGKRRRQPDAAEFRRGSIASFSRGSLCVRFTLGQKRRLDAQRPLPVRPNKQTSPDGPTGRVRAKPGSEQSQQRSGDRLHIELLRTVGASTASTSVALTCGVEEPSTASKAPISAYLDSAAAGFNFLDSAAGGFNLRGELADWNSADRSSDRARSRRALS